MRLRQLRPFWLPANLGCAPIWLQANLNLVFIFQGARIETFKTSAAFTRCSGRREGKAMKKAVLVPALIVLLASIPVWAKKNPPRQFMLRDLVILNGAQVPAGLYELTWETHGSTAGVTLRKDGQFVATAHGAWVKNGIKFTEDAALLRVNFDGTKSLIEIRIAGESRAIVFDHTDVTVHYSALRP
jgi:hypothetical protein